MRDSDIRKSSLKACSATVQRRLGEPQHRDDLDYKSAHACHQAVIEPSLSKMDIFADEVIE
jgi:hypothetical protein